MTHITIERAKLEQVLKALKSTSGLPHWPAIFATITDFEQALAAPVQPVAWMHEWDDGERIPMLRKRDVDSSDIDSPKSVRPLVFGDTTPPAAQPAPDLQVELDATNRQVEILSDALAESRRELAALKANAALDKMAENARELGLDYEPVDGTQVSKVWWDGEKLMAKPIPLEDFYLPTPVQPVQEPVAQAWDEGYCAGIDDERTSEASIGIAGFDAKVEPARNNPYRTTPPAQPAPVAFEVGLVEWVGNKLMATPKVTTTPPASWMEMVTANLVREGVSKHKARELAEHFYGLAQRPFVGLTDEEIIKAVPGGIYDCLNDPWDCGVGDGDTLRSIKKDVLRIARAIEAKLKENT